MSREAQVRICEKLRVKLPRLTRRVITDAIDENAVYFYKKHDFKVLPGQETFPKRIFIPNTTVFDAYDGQLRNKFTSSRPCRPAQNSHIFQ
jgi:hypothetical protein